MLALILIGGVFAALVYLYYQPLPAKARQPVKQRFILIVVNIFKDVVYIMSKLGFGTEIEIMKSVGMPGPKAPDGIIETRETEFEGVKVRIYRRTGDSDLQPGLVYIHGGGWCLGGLEYNDGNLRKFVIRKKMVVVSIDYRLAPDHPYPVPLNDCYDAVKHFVLNAREYGADPNRIGLMGDSAGGNLSCAVSLKLQEEKSVPPLTCLVLVYPALQALDYQLPSYIEFKNRRRTPGVLDSFLMAQFWINYAFGKQTKVCDKDLLENRHLTDDLKRYIEDKYVKRDHLPDEILKSSARIIKRVPAVRSLSSKVERIFLDPLFSPLMASDDKLTKLPKVYLLTCEVDPLRDDGLLFVQRMKDLKHEITHRHMEAIFHGFFSNDFIDTGDAISEISDYLDQHL